MQDYVGRMCVAWKAFLLSLCLASAGQAEFIIVTLEQVGGAQSIFLGGTAQFAVKIRAETALINNFDGLDFNLGADDNGTAVDSGMRTAGGRFSVASAPQFGGFNIGPTSSFLVFSGLGYPGSLPTNDQTIALVTLDTTGATPGTYSMQLSDIAAIDTSPGAINTKFWNASGALTYTILPVAVPEPGVTCLLGLAMAGFGLRRLRRRASIVASEMQPA